MVINIHHGSKSDFGFTGAARVENIRRIDEVTKLMVSAGLLFLCCFISPFADERQAFRYLLGDGMFSEIFIDTSLDECINRDPKGLYAEPLLGQIPIFTWINSPYERPSAPDLLIDGMIKPSDAAARIVNWVISRQKNDEVDI